LLRENFDENGDTYSRTGCHRAFLQFRHHIGHMKRSDQVVVTPTTNARRLLRLLRQYLLNSRDRSIFANFEYLYLSQVLFLDPLIVLKTLWPKLIRATKLHLPYLNAYLSLLWTATFAVKFSFLAYFRQLVQSVANMRTYFWIVVAFTIVSWMFVIGEPFILCHYFGAEWSIYDPLSRFGVSLAVVVPHLW
jgi:hypothetical protein